MDPKILLALGKLSGLADGLAMAASSGATFEGEQLEALAKQLAGLASTLGKMAEKS